MTSDQAAKDRRFSAGPECSRLAGPGHVFDDFGTLYQQVVDRVVDPIQFGPQCGQATGAPTILGSRLLLRGSWRIINS